MRRLTVPLGAALAGLLAACGTAAGAAVPTARPDAASAAAVPGYRTVASVRLPGSATRWDYQLLDARGGRLYLAHEGADQVVAVDLGQLRVAGTIPGIESVQGLAMAPTLGRLYASATGRNEVAVIDVATGQVVARVPAGEAPDGMAYVSALGRLFVSDSAGTGETVIDAGTNQPVARVELGEGIGNSQYDPWTGRVLVAVAGRQELDAIDPQSATVVARYPLPGCQGAHGVQVDVSGQDRAFVACEGNARLLGLDLDTGRITASLEVGTGPDALSLDPGLHRLYVASESGVLTVVDAAGSGPTVLTRGSAGPDAHSVAVDPDTHLVYLPLASVGGRSVLRVLAPQ
ncbi:MAG TPA: YncE family protein [Candidatus Dormibacteraeota bacterium]|nr:YncE family protein [Candidatus Dormibacteraeota bacterium]